MEFTFKITALLPYCLTARVLLASKVDKQKRIPTIVKDYRNSFFYICLSIPVGDACLNKGIADIVTF